MVGRSPREKPGEPHEPKHNTKIMREFGRGVVVRGLAGAPGKKTGSPKNPRNKKIHA